MVGMSARHRSEREAKQIRGARRTETDQQLPQGATKRRGA
jgi:hypothetical protein